MTLELNRVAAQVKAMGRSLPKQSAARRETIEQARKLLERFSTEQTALLERISRAEQAQQRSGWSGAVPHTEPLAPAYPLPPCPERVTVIGGDGSQILPDRHAITLYYLINVGSIIYRHGSNLKPETYNPPPRFYYEPAHLFDGAGRLISGSEVNIQRDVAELEVLAQQLPSQPGEPVAALIDGPLTLYIGGDLPASRRDRYVRAYIQTLDRLQQAGAWPAGYIDRPGSDFVLALLHLAGLETGAITEEALRQNRFRYLSDADLFDFLAPGQRSAIFALGGEGLEKYSHAGHAPCFFYLNVSSDQSPKLARIEFPAWLLNEPGGLDTLHAVIFRQARLTGGYPYVLARAHELAVISPEEREAFEMMISLEMRRNNQNPALSPKQMQKEVLGRQESYNNRGNL